LWVIPKKGLRV